MKRFYTHLTVKTAEIIGMFQMSLIEILSLQINFPDPILSFFSMFTLSRSISREIE